MKLVVNVLTSTGETEKALPPSGLQPLVINVESGNTALTSSMKLAPLVKSRALPFV